VVISIARDVLVLVPAAANRSHHLRLNSTELVDVMNKGKQERRLHMHKPLVDNSVEQGDESEHLHPRRPALVMALILAGLGSGALVGLWTQRPGAEGYAGYVQAVSKIVTADRNARIAEILVSEGQEVAPGDPLFVLSDAELEAARLTAHRTVQRLDAELSQAQAQAVVELQWRLDALDQELFEAQLKSAQFLREKMAHEVKQLAHQELIERIGMTQAADQGHSGIRRIGQSSEEKTNEKIRMEALLKIHEAENAIEVAGAQIELCDKRMQELKQLRGELPEKVRLSMGIHVAEARLAEAQDVLARLNASTEELTLRAELPGKVGDINVHTGQAVTADVPLVEVLDTHQRYLLVHVPSTEIDKFSEESEVDLEFPNDEHRRGKVLKTSSQATPIPVGTNDVTKIAVKIVPAGKLWPNVPFRTTIHVRPRD